MTPRQWMITLFLVGVSALSFTHQADAQTLFVPLPVCRIVDTRNAPGPTGGPVLTGGNARTFPITGACGVPASATAAALQFTTVAASGAGFLTVYASDISVPGAALMQFGPGQSQIVTNTANLGLSSGGMIAAFVSATPVTVHLIIDVYGYFAPAAAN